MNDSQQEHMVRKEPIDDGVLLHVTGEIDLSGSPVLRHELAAVQKAKPRRVIVNLTHVEYMDSSGVATLVEALQVARGNGSRLVLCGMNERVRSIFEIARLDTVFKIVGDVDSAKSA